MEQILGSSSRDVLREPVRGGRNLTTQQRRTINLSGTIAGWGSDLDPAKRPGVPRDKAPELGVEHLYPSFEKQLPNFTIHKSTEHAQLTPVFGTSCPPRALSGLLRNIAYKFSEGRLARWLTLMFADRVDMIEGIFSDLSHLRIPNVFREMGLGSEVRYNGKAFAIKVLVAIVVIAAIVFYYVRM